MFEVKQSDETAYVVFKKVWTQRAHGSSDADYLSPSHVPRRTWDQNQFAPVST